MLIGKFIHYKPIYAKQELKNLQIPFEEWTSDLCSDLEIRIDLCGLKEKQKLNLCKLVGLNLEELNNTDFLIFF